MRIRHFRHISAPVPATHQWLRTGDAAFAAMLEAIQKARHSVRLETYIYAAAPLGIRFRDALMDACRRGVTVSVLIDAFGSLYLSDAFWQGLRGCGGQVRWFNPISLERIGFRDHRKLLVCDDEVAFVGGYNIAPEYEGDGVTHGWRDLGLRLTGPLVAELSQSFDVLFERSDLEHQPFTRLRKARVSESVFAGGHAVLASGPGRAFNSFKRVLRHDLSKASVIRIMSAYFLPTWRVRHELYRAARRGANVELILAGKTDVGMAQLACRRLYQQMLNAGVKLFEYQPQVLHAKLVIVDDLVYVGSANLDIRSLSINYELMLRLNDHQLAAEASDYFADARTHCVAVDAETWRTSRTLWQKLKERWAYFVLARVDPYLAKRQMKRLR